MNPNQQQPAPNYDFIMNGNQKPRGRFSLPGGNSRNGRIIIFSVGILVLIIATFMFFSLLSSSSRANTDRVIEITQQQQELIRIADIGTSKARTSASRNLAMTTKVSMMSAQNQLVGLLKKNGHKVGGKQLALKQDPAATSALSAAALNNTFDEVFTKLINEKLSEYRASLKTAFSGSTSKKEKSLLDENFQGAGVLLTATASQ